MAAGDTFCITLLQESPQTVRNAPPVAGAIYWSRQLLKRIEDPMKIFRENKAITQLTDFGRIVRIYNRLATALVTFESLWFTQWKNRIEQARAGLRATLFVHHPETREIVVNADERWVLALWCGIYMKCTHNVGLRKELWWMLIRGEPSYQFGIYV